MRLCNCPPLRGRIGIGSIALGLALLLPLLIGAPSARGADAPTTAQAVVAGAAAPAAATPAAEPEPDKTGAFMSTPTSASTPGFTAVTEKSSPADMAKAINSVAGAQARNYFGVNFVWVLVSGFLVIFMKAGF